jgi:hypothetical protein
MATTELGEDPTVPSVLGRSLQGNLFQPPSTVPVKAHKDPVT